MFRIKLAWFSVPSRRGGKFQSICRGPTGPAKSPRYKGKLLVSKAYLPVRSCRYIHLKTPVISQLSTPECLLCDCFSLAISITILGFISEVQYQQCLYLVKTRLSVPVASLYDVSKCILRNEILHG